MNEAIANNIRQHRRRLSWTQEHLAAAASLNVRTVQRAEEGRGMSAETLTAIAGALDVTIEQLRLDETEFLARALGVEPAEATPEVITKKLDELAARYTTVPVGVVDTSADLGPILGTDAMYFDCIAEDESVQDTAAELNQWIHDLLLLVDDLEPIHKREYLKSTFDVIQRLHDLGCRVSVGIQQHALRVGEGDPIPWRSLYVIVAPEDEVKKFVMVERKRAIRF